MRRRRRLNGALAGTADTSRVEEPLDDDEAIDELSDDEDDEDDEEYEDDFQRRLDWYLDEMLAETHWEPEPDAEVTAYLELEHQLANGYVHDDEEVDVYEVDDAEDDDGPSADDPGHGWYADESDGPTVATGLDEALHRLASRTIDHFLLGRQTWHQWVCLTCHLDLPEVGQYQGIPILQDDTRDNYLAAVPTDGSDPLVVRPERAMLSRSSRSRDRE